jgi:prevent-host-death family protein
MQVVNIHDAKTRLSELIARAVAGEPFVIAKAGKPLVKVEAIEAPPLSAKRRLGGLEGKFKLPEDIKTPFAEDIERMFYGDSKE